MHVIRNIRIFCGEFHCRSDWPVVGSGVIDSRVVSQPATPGKTNVSLMGLHVPVHIRYGKMCVNKKNSTVCEIQFVIFVYNQKSKCLLGSELKQVIIKDNKLYAILVNIISNMLALGMSPYSLSTLVMDECLESTSRKATIMHESKIGGGPIQVFESLVSCANSPL